MLGSDKLVAFVASTDMARARAFYRDALGLRLVEESPNALVYDVGGTTLRVTKVDAFEPAPFTVLGWEVTDVAAAITALGDNGVRFERFDGMEQDALGVWQAPGGAKVAWFVDPSGNTLSLTEPASPA